MKLCAKCGEVKPFTEFYKRQDAVNENYRSRCKSCYYAENKEWVKKNPSKPQSYSREWHERNPRYSQWATNRLRADSSGIENTLTLEEWKEIWESYGGRCAYCLSAKARDIEHVIGVVNGGENTKNNVVPACERCNKKKRMHNLIPHIASKFWPPTEDFFQCG